MGQDLTIIAEAYDGSWRLAEPMKGIIMNNGISLHQKKMDDDKKKYDYFLPDKNEPTAHPVDLWDRRDTKLQAELLSRIKNYGLPEDCSTALREYFEKYCASYAYGVGWCMVSKIPIPQIKSSLNLSKYVNTGQLRIVFWFS